MFSLFLLFSLFSSLCCTFNNVSVNVVGIGWRWLPTVLNDTSRSRNRVSFLFVVSDTLPSVTFAFDAIDALLASTSILLSNCEWQVPVKTFDVQRKKVEL